jgi:hypothetical protein
MTTTTGCFPQVVSHVAAAGSVGSLVPDPAFNWSDADDTSYLETTAKLTRATYTGRTDLTGLALPDGATVTAVTAHLRVQAMPGTDTPARVGVTLRNPDLTFFASIGDDNGTGGTGGWTIPSTGSILDLSLDIDDTMLAASGTTLADLLALLTAGATLDIGALAISPSTTTVTARIYEFKILVEYANPIDLPCDEWVDLDLSTAVFLTYPPSDTPGPYGQYSDGVIWPVADAGGPGIDGAPDFYIPGLRLDALKPDQVKVTYDTTSPHDGGGRRWWLSGVTGGDEQESYQTVFAGTFFSGGSNTVNGLVADIGPGIGQWDDGTEGVAAGCNNLYFETDPAGAVSRIQIRKVCGTTDGPIAPVDSPSPGGAGDAPDPDAGDPITPVTDPDQPAGAQPRGAGFLTAASRGQAPTRAEIVVDGHWLSLATPVGELTWTHVWPGGSANASWNAPDCPAALGRRGRLVQIKHGGSAIWAGITTEPDGDEPGQMNAVGLFTLGTDYPALDADGNSSTIPDDAIDAAIARGLPWKRRESISDEEQDVDTSQGPVTLGDLLTAYANDAGLRWGVDPEGYVYAAADPTAPDWYVLPLDGRLVTDDADLATALLGRYNTGSGYATVRVVDPMADVLGDAEDTIDLTARGPITEGKATNILTRLLNLGRARPTIASPLVLRYGDLLSAGQVPVALERAKAGDLARVLGQFDDTQALAALPYLDVLVGQSEYDTDRELTLTPMGAPPRSFVDLLAQIPITKKRRAA